MTRFFFLYPLTLPLGQAGYSLSWTLDEML